MRAAIDKVVEGKPSAAALEQALRNEDAEPHMVRHTGARREVGFSEAPEQVEGKPRSVIVDLDRDGRRIPIDGDADLPSGELNRILNQVVEPVHDLRAAPDEGLFPGGLAGGRKDQPHPLIAMGCGSLIAA